MQQFILPKDQIAKFYGILAKEYTFYAPTKEKNNIIFKKITKAEDIVLDYLNSKVPPKEIIFPKTDVLFEYKINGKEIEIEDIKDLDEKKIIFGIRPCDAYSFFLLENFFSQGEVKDEIILKRRENTVLIGIACNTPKTTCFCTSVGGNPFQKENMDVFLVDLGNKFIVEGISDKGSNLIKKLSWLTKATDADNKSANDLALQAEQLISTKMNLEGIDKVLDPNFIHPIWEEISESCLGCGTCSFLCPTCTCFDVIDEKIPNENRGRRIRIWDTCQFCLYSLHTSGHNPRESSIERCRNRILHKFCYYPENYNLLGCVGCGRCIQLCPVNNDLRKILEKISNIEKVESEKVNA
ncbi:MAG: 4Fe-4S dicluster domain-containing protein [Promethearchaeota archaeon]